MPGQDMRRGYPIPDKCRTDCRLGGAFDLGIRGSLLKSMKMEKTIKEKTNMKKLIIMILALTFVFALAAPAAMAADAYTVGICQLVQHPALDAATQGFKDALTKALGAKVSFVEQNASGDSATCAIICNRAEIRYRFLIECTDGVRIAFDKCGSRTDEQDKPDFNPA